MQLSKLALVGTMLATTTTAIPKPHQLQSKSEPEPDSDSIPQPDPRFASFTHPHPLVELRIRDQPTLSTNTSASKRNDQVWGVYEYSERNFQGSCLWHQVTPGANQCQNRQFNLGGSIGPDRGLFCHIFQYRDCQTKPGRDEIGFTYPGTGDCVNYKGWKHPAEFVTCPQSWVCDGMLKLEWAEGLGRGSNVAGTLNVPSVDGVDTTVDGRAGRFGVD